MHQSRYTVRFSKATQSILARFSQINLHPRKHLASSSISPANDMPAPLSLHSLSFHDARDGYLLAPEIQAWDPRTALARGDIFSVCEEIFKKMPPSKYPMSCFKEAVKCADLLETGCIFPDGTNGFRLIENTNLQDITIIRLESKMSDGCIVSYRLGVPSIKPDQHDIFPSDKYRRAEEINDLARVSGVDLLSRAIDSRGNQYAPWRISAATFTNPDLQDTDPSPCDRMNDYEVPSIRDMAEAASRVIWPELF